LYADTCDIGMCDWNHWVNYS